MKNRRHAKKITQSPRPAKNVQPSTSEPAHVPCRVWYAYEKPHGCKTDFSDYSGLLLTEPDDPAAPIAYVWIEDGNLAAAVELASGILAWPDALKAPQCPAEDLRTLCRWWSREATSEFLFDVRILPAEGTLALCEWMPGDLKPFCPIRLAHLVEQYARLRWPELRERYPYNSIGISKMCDDERDAPMDDCVDAIVRRVDGTFPHDWNLASQAALGKAKTSPAPGRPIRLVPPERRALDSVKVENSKIVSAAA